MSSTEPAVKPYQSFDDWRTDAASLQSLILTPGYWSALEKNAAQWADEASISPFWKLVMERVPGWAAEFNGLGGELLAPGGLPSFQGKSLKSIESKLLRATTSTEDLSRIWDNGESPAPLINDLVRTRVQCRFLDGVEFFATRLEHLAAETGVTSERDRVGRMEGYFAQHFRFKDTRLFRFGSESRPIEVWHEVQVATELATRIWDATHGLYEFSREQTEMPEEWQWSADDPRFIARQMGHMIHLADGLLVQLRNASVKGRRAR